LSTFAFLPNYLSAKLKLFGQILFSISKTRDLNMDWPRLSCLAIHQVWQE